MNSDLAGLRGEGVDNEKEGWGMETGSGDGSETGPVTEGEGVQPRISIGASLAPTSGTKSKRKATSNNILLKYA